MNTPVEDKGSELKNVEWEPAKREPFLAIASFYEPFTMGGNVWQFHAYPVQAMPLTLVENIKAFVFEAEDRFHIHEAESGGWLSSGKSLSEAIAVAVQNISSTPDLKEQIKILGKASDKKQTTFEIARHRLSRSSERKT